MVKRCIAAGCSNTYKENVSLFTFPRDPALRERWTRQVRRTRDDWSGPTATSSLCSDNFTEDCFVETSLMAAKFEIKTRRTLRPDTVPTIFEKRLHREQPRLLQIKELPAAVLSHDIPKLQRRQGWLLRSERQQGKDKVSINLW